MEVGFYLSYKYLLLTLIPISQTFSKSIKHLKQVHIFFPVICLKITMTSEHIERLRKNYSFHRYIGRLKIYASLICKILLKHWNPIVEEFLNYIISFNNPCLWLRATNMILLEEHYDPLRGSQYQLTSVTFIYHPKSEWSSSSLGMDKGITTTCKVRRIFFFLRALFSGLWLLAER